MKNNLDQHLQWLQQSKAHIPTNPILQDITTAISASSNTTHHMSKSNDGIGSASAPSRPQEGIIPSNADFSPILSNVEKTTRRSSGLRLARRDTSLSKSSGSLPTKSKSSSPQPPSQHHQNNNTVAKPTAHAVIDLTFDDDVVEAPRAVPAKRKLPAPIHEYTPSAPSKRQQRENNNDFTSDDFDDTEFNEVLEQHEIRKQTSFTAADLTITSNSTNPLPPPSVPKPTAVQNAPSIFTKPSGESELVSAQKSYIQICEKRIELLVKRNIINESTALSEDEKRRKRNELSAELVRLEKEQNQSKIKLNLISVTTVPGPDPTIAAIRAPSPAPLPISAPVLNPMTSNLMSSRANMEVLQSSRDPRERRIAAPGIFESVNSDAEDDLELTSRDNRPPGENDDFEEDDEFGDRTGDGLVTSQVNPEDLEMRSSDREFIEGGDTSEEEDGEYKDAEEMNDLDSEFEETVDPAEVENLANHSDEEDRESVHSERDHGSELPVYAEDVEEDDIIQSQDEMDGVFSTIRSENFNDEEFDDVDEIGSVDNERETCVQPPIIDVDVDLDSIEANTSTNFNEVSAPLSKPRQVEQEAPIFDEGDFDCSFPPSSPGDTVEEIPRPQQVPLENYSWTSEVFEKLNSIFKLQSFRQNQLEAVNSTLSGKDTFVLMPTGGGKSLCYQLPAVVKSGKTHGATIVVSPLISLMQDQVEHLWDKNIKAGMINSKGSAEERRTTFNLFVDGFLDLVYLSPEMISASNQAKNAIDRLYKQGKLARIVVDEAHCVSSWGHDFRPDYKHLGYFKQNYPDIPVMALTATANDHVKMDIIHNLNLVDPVFLKQSFNRTNLFYEVLNKDKDHMKHIEMSILGKFRDQTGIIYCHSKNSCEQTSEKLNDSGVKCAFYHAGMDSEDRLDIQKKWQNGTIKVICATIAFGMGIDKADVRFVIHLTLPRTLEGYYQETGRAGRDGKYSYCIMYYGFRDARTLQNMISRDKDLDKNGKEKHLTKLRQVIQYCENSTDCRRQQVLQYFNEQFDKKDCGKNCDNCKKGLDASSKYEKDVTEFAKKMTELVKSIEDQKVTLIYCQDVFKGSKSNKITSAGHDDLPYHGAGKELDKVDIERIAFHLIAEKILEEFSVFNAAGFASSYIRAGPHANKLLTNRKKIIMTFFTDSKRTRPGSANSAASLNRAPSRNSTVANRSKTLNREDMDGFRFDGNGNGQAFNATRSFSTARAELHRENSDMGSPATPIRLSEANFNSEEERRNFAKAYEKLKEARDRAMSSLGVSGSRNVVSDQVLKEMAHQLPSSDVEFKRLNGFTNELQKGYYRHFRKSLEELQHLKKLSNGASGASHRPVQRTPGTAAQSRSVYFNGRSEEEERESQNIINQMRASQSVSSSTGTNSKGNASKSTGYKKRSKSSQSSRYNKYGNKSKRSNSSSNKNKPNGTKNQTSLSQRSKKVMNQSAMRL